MAGLRSNSASIVTKPVTGGGGTAPALKRPATGSTPRAYAKINMSTMAHTKAGVTTPPSEISRTSVSTQVSRYEAARIPSGTPTATISRPA